MDNETLLEMLATRVSAGEISREEVLGRVGHMPTSQSPSGTGHLLANMSVTKILYVLGVAIVITGLLFFVWQIWEDIGSGSRIAITLGLGILTTALGSVLFAQKPGESIGPIFHTIGGTLIPGGALVTLYELGHDFTSLWPVVYVFGAIFVFYLLLLTVQRHAVLAFFAVANGTTFLYLLVGTMLAETYYYDSDIYAYLTMAIGASYILLAYASGDGWNKPLAGLLRFFGAVGFLGAAFSEVFDSWLWELGYFPIVIFGLFLAVSMKSRSILVVSTLFLLAHLSYITSEYFADSIGWPISLVILGFICIGLGYASITINKRYIRQTEV
ncbi:hypothetical protein HY416_03155 [Candidatus Kaiserbacteria bacterium]|nr:hypothetical protein [Candidatus Kaiserbacteria bacterium]